MGGELKKRSRFKLVYSAVRGWVATIGDAETVLGVSKAVWPKIVALLAAGGAAVTGVLESMPTPWIIFTTAGTWSLLQGSRLATFILADWRQTRRPNLVVLPLQTNQSALALGNPKEAPAFIVRHLHLFNKGASTELADWHVTVTLPGGNAYDAPLIDPKNVDAESWNAFVASLEADPHTGTLIVRNGVLRVPMQQSVEATLIAMISELAWSDVPVGSDFDVKCTDGFGRSWDFAGPMRVRKRSLQLTPREGE